MVHQSTVFEIVLEGGAFLLRFNKKHRRIIRSVEGFWRRCLKCLVWNKVLWIVISVGGLIIIY